MNHLNNRLTQNAKEVIARSQKDSHQRDLRKINPIFLLKAILEQQGSLGNNIAKNFDLSSNKIDKFINDNRKTITNISVYDVLMKAFQLAAASKSPFVGTEHMIHGLFILTGEMEKSLPKDTAKNQLASQQNILPLSSEKNNSSLNDFLGEINMLIDNFFTTSKEKNKKHSFLQSYCVNLNGVVTKKDHSLIGRKHELERISNILGRKVKNNPVLIGDPGVGKTAIVEGLALQIAEGKAPYYLANKKIMSLDLGSLIAGTTFRGEFEARLKEIINEAKINSNIILFIDEIHNLVGAGNAVGGMDAANLLKPALSRGQIQVIGATTFDEYRKYIEKDAALERRFQPIVVKEPSLEETVEVLRGIKNSYESYHNIKINDTALTQAAYLAKRYLHDRFLPDSAIDLIDETAAKIRSKLANLKIFDQVRQKEQQLEQLILEKETLVMHDHYEAAIKLREKEKELSKELTGLKKKQKEYEDSHPIKLEVEDIKKTLTNIVSVPLSLLSHEKGDVIPLVKSNLEKNLVGQPKVVSKILQTLLRQFSGIGNPNRPLGSFLFIGPTGVGKTLTAKLLAQSISTGQGNSLIQINMSEFMERHTVSRLLGAPAGYVGYDESGELAEKVRRNPYSVVLFDEIEKADPAILNILLQILEEGTITDSKGRMINFKNTILILTSNIGTCELNQVSKLGFETGKAKPVEKPKDIQQNILDELNQQLTAELINRLDHIIIFDNLDRKDLSEIVRREMEKLSNRLKEKSLTLKVDEDVIKFLATKSIGKDQGARLVRRKIEELIEPAVANLILKGKKIKGISLSLQKNRIVAR